MSPLDSVFWNHHCMVDYCWADWNINRNHSNTNDTNWTNKQFTEFCDENGAPVTVEALTTVLFPILIYQYEASQIGTSTPRVLSLTSKTARSLQNSLRAGAKVRLDFQQRFELKEAVEMAVGQPVARSITVQPAQFRSVLQRNNRQRALLTIANVDLPKESDFFVRVFLNKPDANRQTPITDPHYAGSFGFFGGDHSAHQQSPERPGFIVDLTNTLRRLTSPARFPPATRWIYNLFRFHYTSRIPLCSTLQPAD
jgi:tyrosinase